MQVASVKQGSEAHRSIDGGCPLGKKYNFLVMLKHYVIESLEPSLYFGFFTSLIGVLAAARTGHFLFLQASLVIAGILIAQAGVNLLDDYQDYMSGLDKETVKTKFSGGSALIAKRLIDPKKVLYISMSCLSIAAVIGVSLLVYNQLLLPFMVFGALAILFYPRYIVKIPLMQEPFVAFSFVMVCVGSFLAAGGSLAGLAYPLLAFIPAGLLVGIASLAHSVPDARFDAKHGRRSITVVLNSNHKRAYVYLSFYTMTYVLVVSGVILGGLPIFSLSVLLTIPLCVVVFNAIRSYRDPKSFEGSMGRNALSAFIYYLLLAIAFVI